MQIRPYLIVPKLIPQPTWGGNYIASCKGLDTAVFGSLCIGQSYELASDSMLSTVLRSQLLPIEIGTASDGSTQEVVGDKSTMFSLQSLIVTDPAGVLGKRVAELHQNRMQVLIKFTQAKGNSFQVHVRHDAVVGVWKPKPESWYFFEKGKMTLGLKSPIDTEKYKDTCLQIEAKAKALVNNIQQPIFNIDAIRKELADFIWTHSPYSFVNQLDVPAGTVVDLSAGGIHHSWEEGEEIPNGNIVYEVQRNVMDNECTLRSFDKGKIADDGSIRSVHIDDYFKALDVDESRNNPERYIRSVGTETLFASLHYCSKLLQISSEYRGVEAATNPDSTFHHLFVKEGEIEVQTHFGTLNIAQGASIFIPASTGAYSIRSRGKASLIKTSVEDHF